MTESAVAEVIQLFTEPKKIQLVPRAFEIEIQNKIHAGELASMQKEQAQIASGVTLYDGPLAKLWIPPSPLDRNLDRHLGPGELVEIWRGNSLVPYQLVRGETKFMRWRRQFDIFKELLPELKASPHLVDKRVRWEFIYSMFEVGYGVMSMCRSVIDGETYLLCGIRSSKLGTRGIGMMSFPAGTVKPFETLDTAVRRELFHEGFVRMATSYPGWALYDGYTDAPSMTFGKLMEVKIQDAMPEDGCYEVVGKKYIWMRQKDVGSLILGDPGPAIRRFEEMEIPVPVDSEGAPVLKITDDARIVFTTFIGLGL